MYHTADKVDQFQLSQLTLHQQDDQREHHLSLTSTPRSICQPLTTMPKILSFHIIILNWCRQIRAYQYDLRIELNVFKPGRMLRGSTSSRRSRTRVSEGILSTQNSDLKFWAGTELSSKRIYRSKFWQRRHLQAEHCKPRHQTIGPVMPQETTRSGTLSKHSRTSLSIPGIDRCLRNEFCVNFFSRSCFARN